jgi:CheY-like chemotaxis protein
MRQVLEEAGYVVLPARNGREALRMLQMTSPEVVITDLLMPEMDGLEVTLALHRESPTTRIIAVTGGAAELDYLDVARTFGAHRTLRKPIRTAELLEAVREELSMAAWRRGPHSPMASDNQNS